MRKFYAILVLLVVFGGLSYAFQTRNKGVDTTKQVADSTDEFVYRKLANGTTIYEPAATAHELVNISPAAGAGGVAGAGDGAPSVAGKNKYKYDPLTQTYRRIDTSESVDTGRFSRQDNH